MLFIWAMVAPVGRSSDAHRRALGERVCGSADLLGRLSCWNVAAAGLSARISALWHRTLVVRHLRRLQAARGGRCGSGADGRAGDRADRAASASPSASTV